MVEFVDVTTVFQLILFTQTVTKLLDNCLDGWED